MGLLSEPPARVETGVHHNAAMLLRQRGITVTQVVRVNPDSILYLGSRKRPMTAWLTYDGARLDVRPQSGFPAFPLVGLIPEPLLSRET